MNLRSLDKQHILRQAPAEKVQDDQESQSRFLILDWLLQEVLPCCHEYGVQDAEAYLLERLGDIPAALQVESQ